MELGPSNVQVTKTLQNKIILEHRQVQKFAPSHSKTGNPSNKNQIPSRKKTAPPLKNQVSPRRAAERDPSPKKQKAAAPSRQPAKPAHCQDDLSPYFAKMPPPRSHVRQRSALECLDPQTQPSRRALRIQHRSQHKEDCEVGEGVSYCNVKKQPTLKASALYFSWRCHCLP